MDMDVGVTLRPLLDPAVQFVVSAFAEAFFPDIDREDVDRRPPVLTAYCSCRRWDSSSLEMNTAAWVRRSMPSFANKRDT